MAVPKRYLRPPEGAVTTYNWADTATGTGYITLFGWDSDDDQFKLSTQQFHSRSAQTTRTTDGETERNFDLTFNLPLRVLGDLYVTFTYRLNITAGGATYFCKLRVLHVDKNAVETEIAAQQSSDSLTATATRRTTMIFNVDKSFKKDEKIRIEIILNGADITGGDTIYLFHDGAGRDMSAGNLDVGTSVTAPTTFLIQLPFRVDI